MSHRATTNPLPAPAENTKNTAPVAKDTEKIEGIIGVVKANREALYITANNLLKFNGQYKLAVKVLSGDKTKVIALHLQAIKGFGKKPDTDVKRGSEAV